MFTPTLEQATIVETALTGKDIAVQAGAGAAKTTTCYLVAKQLTKPSLYIAFNKSIATEAGDKFPLHVDCKTIHSLAYASIVKGSGFAKKGRLVGYYDNREAEQILDSLVRNMPEMEKFDFIYSAIELAKLFMQSNCLTIDEYFVKYAPEIDGTTIKGVKLLWREYINPNGKFKTTHDVYLKLYQLSKPDLSQTYSVIYLDEFQDTNPVSLDIFLKQKGKCQLIAVGDEYQSIYAWRGAINAFSLIDNSFVRLNLTESFRFTSDIADKANFILKQLGDFKVIGNAKPTKVKNEAYIVRNNSTLFNLLLSAADKEQKVYVIAELKELWSMMYTAATLMYTKPGEKPNFKYPHKQIASFRTWYELKNCKEPEIKKIVNLVSTSSNVVWNNKTGVSAAIEKAKSAIVENQEDADFTLVTGHKSKGLEWDKISLSDDFCPMEMDDRKKALEIFKNSQGFQLLYVAITRAKYEIEFGSGLQEFLESP